MTTVWPQGPILCSSARTTPAQAVHPHTHQCANAQRGACNLQSHCSSYSQSCKIQLYPVTWDHLQEMKSITKESKKEKGERVAKRGIFSDTTLTVIEKENSVWQYKQERQRQFHLNSLQVEKISWKLNHTKCHEAKCIFNCIVPAALLKKVGIRQVILKASDTDMETTDPTKNKHRDRLSISTNTHTHISKYLYTHIFIMSTRQPLFQ